MWVDVTQSNPLRAPKRWRKEEFTPFCPHFLTFLLLLFLGFMPLAHLVLRPFLGFQPTEIVGLLSLLHNHINQFLIIYLSSVYHLYLHRPPPPNKIWHNQCLRIFELRFISNNILIADQSFEVGKEGLQVGERIRG